MTSGQGILSLAIKEKSSLYAAFIPFVTNGGLFIPTNRAYKLGDEVFMLLNLMDEPERIPVAGKIIWITPRGTGGSRTPGVGVQFSEQDRGDTRNRIENLLGILLQSDKSTYTM
jgi:type IV pilus assembly protein PilZ